MHPNSSFRETPNAEALAFAKDRGFGVLTMNGAGGILASHIPFIVNNGWLEAHLVRSTAIARHLSKHGEAVGKMIVSGPDGYVSPDWYGEPDLVPTWNYVAVHIEGTVRLRGSETLLGHLDRLSKRFEETLAPKPIWTHEKMSDGVMEKMMRSIVPIEMEIGAVESTFKLNQNRTSSAQAGAAMELAKRASPGLETPRLAALMRAAAEKTDF